MEDLQGRRKTLYNDMYKIFSEDLNFFNDKTFPENGEAKDEFKVMITTFSKFYFCK